MPHGIFEAFVSTIVDTLKALPINDVVTNGEDLAKNALGTAKDTLGAAKEVIAKTLSDGKHDFSTQVGEGVETGQQEAAETSPEAAETLREKHRQLMEKHRQFSKIFLPALIQMGKNSARNKIREFKYAAIALTVIPEAFFQVTADPLMVLYGGLVCLEAKRDYKAFKLKKGTEGDGASVKVASPTLTKEDEKELKKFDPLIKKLETMSEISPTSLRVAEADATSEEDEKLRKKLDALIVKMDEIDKKATRRMTWLSVGIIYNSPPTTQVIVAGMLITLSTVILYGLIALIKKGELTGLDLLEEQSKSKKTFGSSLLNFTDGLQKAIPPIGRGAKFVTGGRVLLRGLAPVEHGLDDFTEHWNFVLELGFKAGVWASVSMVLGALADKVEASPTYQAMQTKARGPLIGFMLGSNIPVFPPERVVDRKHHIIADRPSSLDRLVRNFQLQTLAT